MQEKEGAYLSGTPDRISLKRQAPALPANSRLQQKCLTVPNTLAYHDTELIMAVKSFIVQAPKLKLYSDKKNSIYQMDESCVIIN